MFTARLVAINTLGKDTRSNPKELSGWHINQRPADGIGTKIETECDVGRFRLIALAHQFCPLQRLTPAKSNGIVRFSVTSPRLSVFSQQDKTFAGTAPRGNQPQPQGGGFFCWCFNARPLNYARLQLAMLATQRSVMLMHHHPAAALVRLGRGCVVASLDDNERPSGRSTRQVRWRPSMVMMTSASHGGIAAGSRR